MPSLHMPLQSGSDRMLRAMRRAYRRDRYLAILDRVRASMPDAAITTDIIVGFPGETEQDFTDTLDVVRQARFAGAFTFRYSIRPGTPAATMDAQVPADLVQERYERLTALVEETHLRREPEAGRRNRRGAGGRGRGPQGRRHPPDVRPRPRQPTGALHPGPGRPAPRRRRHRDRHPRRPALPARPTPPRWPSAAPGPATPGRPPPRRRQPPHPPPLRPRLPPGHLSCSACPPVPATCILSRKAGIAYPLRGYLPWRLCRKSMRPAKYTAWSSYMARWLPAGQYR